MRCVRSVLKLEMQMENGNGLKLNYKKYKSSMFNGLFCSMLSITKINLQCTIWKYRFSGLSPMFIVHKTNTLSFLYRFPERCPIHLKMKIGNGSHSLIWLFISRMNHVIFQFFFSFQWNNNNRCLSSTVKSFNIHCIKLTNHHSPKFYSATV